MNELTYTMQGDYNLPDLTMPRRMIKRKVFDEYIERQYSI